MDDDKKLAISNIRSRKRARLVELLWGVRYLQVDLEKKMRVATIVFLFAIATAIVALLWVMGVRIF